MSTDTSKTEEILEYENGQETALMFLDYKLRKSSMFNKLVASQTSFQQHDAFIKGFDDTADVLGLAKWRQNKKK